MDVAMNFEMTMRLLFGEKGYHIADLHGNATSRREWLKKTIRKFTREIDAIDTTERHKKMLMHELDEISELVKGGKDPSWNLVYRLLRLAMRLLGFDYVKGAKCHTPVYWRTTGQNLNTVIFSGGDVMQDYYDEKNAIEIRRSVVRDLKSKGLDDYKIALVLNITEYQVKKLRREDA